MIPERPGQPGIPGERQTANLRIWGSGVRISSGAPVSTHLRTRFSVLAREDRLLEHILASPDPDYVVVDFDVIDECLQVSFPKWH